MIRGNCGQSTWGDVPCQDTHEPVQADEDLLIMLEELCPHLINEDGPTMVCCDEDALELGNYIVRLRAQIGFKKCPSCIHNLKKLFCHMECSPDQSKFLSINETSKLDDGRSIVMKLDYYLDEEFAKGIFESCKHVTVLEGSNVIDLTCNTGQANKRCDFKEWIGTIGEDPELGKAPYTVQFRILRNGLIKDGIKYESVNQKYYKCSEASPDSKEPCLCEDCPGSDDLIKSFI